MLPRLFQDQTNSAVTLVGSPSRIISLVPSQTELLYDLGLDKRIVGITRFCVHPPHWKNTRTIIGGTKHFNFDVIDAINPDLIIANKEENYRDGILHLQRRYPVWTSDIVSLHDAFGMITEVGALTETAVKANEIIQHIRSAFAGLRKKEKRKVLYLIWKKPWMAAGSGTFIHNIIEETGWTNVLRDRTRYPELSDEDIRSLHPDVILLSSEPYPFREKHKAELQKLAPGASIALVDGEMFSWYGSRLKLAPDYLNALVL